MTTSQQHNKQSEKVKKAYSMSGIIKRNFAYISRNCFVILYKSLVRSKSDHSMLNIDCKLQIDTLIKVKKINYNKGDYDGLRQNLQLNWQELLLPLQCHVVGL